MSVRLCRFATGVQESKMLTVHTKKEGLRYCDGHIFTLALYHNAWSLNGDKEKSNFRQKGKKNGGLKVISFHGNLFISIKP